jgi:hypothetical protein
VYNGCGVPREETGKIRTTYPHSILLLKNHEYQYIISLDFRSSQGLTTEAEN